jgi:hypothetical protein
LNMCFASSLLAIALEDSESLRSSSATWSTVFGTSAFPAAMGVWPNEHERCSRGK